MGFALKSHYECHHDDTILAAECPSGYVDDHRLWPEGAWAKRVSISGT